MADRLSLANALAEARIDRSAAERIATEIFDAIQHNVATKTDIDLLRSDMESLEQRLRGNMSSLEQRLRAEMGLLEHRLVIRLSSVAVVMAGALFAALRYLPPPH